MISKFETEDLRAVIHGIFKLSPDGDFEDVPGCLAADDPRLEEGVNADGEAFVSRWWAVTFFDGSIERQNERLKELRLDPLFQKPWNEDEIAAIFEGGATFDDMLARIHEEDLGLRPRAGTLH